MSTRHPLSRVVRAVRANYRALERAQQWRRLAVYARAKGDEKTALHADRMLARAERDSATYTEQMKFPWEVRR